MSTSSAQTTLTRDAGQAAARRRRRAREIILGYLLLAPAALLLLIFEFYPIVYGLYISTCDWKLRCVAFIGAENYTRALRDPEMWHALGVTATYSLLSIPIQLGLGLLLASLLFQKIKGRQTLRVIFFLPYITSTVASSAVWSYLYSPNAGLFNKILSEIGLPKQRWLIESRGIFTLLAGWLHLKIPAWAGGPNMALVSLIIFTTWVFIGYNITIFLAGLGNIAPELYEAAKIDGANSWQLVRHITLPLLSPTTFFLLTFTIIGTFKAFNHIYIMTQGGPGDATTTASIFIFEQFYQFNRYGYSAALSFVLFFIILLLTIVQSRLADRWVVYE